MPQPPPRSSGTWCTTVPAAACAQACSSVTRLPLTTHRTRLQHPPTWAASWCTSTISWCMWPVSRCVPTVPWRATNMSWCAPHILGCWPWSCVCTYRVCIYGHMYACIYMCTYVCMFVYMVICMQVYMHVFICMCVYIYIYICILGWWFWSRHNVCVCMVLRLWACMCAHVSVCVHMCLCESIFCVCYSHSWNYWRILTSVVSARNRLFGLPKQHRCIRAFFAPAFLYKIPEKKRTRLLRKD
jgi:hypothetical protein